MEVFVKLFLTTLMITFSASLFAASGYDLTMEISVDGKVVSTVMIKVLEGQKATMTKKTMEEDSRTEKLTEITVVAREGQMSDHKGILLDIEIGHTNGQARSIVSKPQILVQNGKETLFETHEDGGKNKLSLKIVATRTTI